jgi:hypothetical protein
VVDSSGEKENFILAQVIDKTSSTAKTFHYKLGLMDSRSLVCNVGPVANPNPLYKGLKNLATKTFGKSDYRSLGSNFVFINPTHRREYFGLMFIDQSNYPHSDVFPPLSAETIAPLLLRWRSSLDLKLEIGFQNVSEDSFDMSAAITNPSTNEEAGLNGSCVLEEKTDDSCN